MQIEYRQSVREGLKQGAGRCAEEDFHAIFEATPGLYLVLDRELRIVAVNEAYLNATMTRRDEILGRGIFEVFPDNPNDPAADGVCYLEASLRRVLESGLADAMSVQKYDVRKPDGSFEIRYWSPLNSPVLKDDGTVAYIIHRVEEVTEFIQLKNQAGERERQTEALLVRADHMESEIYARSREVAAANLKLKQANQELAQLYEKTRELDRIKTRFFANISHELRTPLALILGPVTARLKKPGLKDEELRGLKVVERNAHLLLRHVNDLLDVAKLEAGEMRLAYSRIDLTALLRFVTSHFESLAAERGVILQAELPPHLVAEIDSEKIQRSVLNLLANAFKVIGTGGWIVLAARTDGDFVEISVEDNGPGVPESMRASIFERFRQLDRQEGRPSSGTGLGLAIVREFVELHGGTVSVQSGREEGALFVLRLPLKAPAGTGVQENVGPFEAEAAATALAGLHEPVYPAVSHEIGNASTPLILLVEDNPDMNAFVAATLRARYRVVSAFDGADGLEKAREFAPDLILSDVMMPRMTGDEMVRRLRTEKIFDDIPIVMLTAKADDSLRIELLQGIVQDYLFKPFSADELLARAEGLLAGRQRKLALLRESEARFRATFEQAAVGIAHVASDGRWLMVNQRLCEILGYAEEELLGHTFQEITWPEDLDKDLSQVASLLRGEISTYSMEKRYIGKGGRIVWAMLTVSLVRGTQGGSAYFISVIEDIGVRKAAEVKLREGAAVFVSTQEGVCITDRDGVILSVNPAFCAITGYGENEVIGRKATLLKSGRHDPEFYQAMWTQLKHAGRWQGEIWNRRKDGEIYPQWLSISAIRDAAGQVVNYVGVSTDLSRLRNSEDKLDFLAHHDALTGLPNRLLLNSRLEHLIEMGRREGRRCAVLFLDFDNFKVINDSLGHRGGDALLQNAARRLREHLPTIDTLARLGGDEFVVVLDDLPYVEQAAAVANDLISLLGQPVHLDSGFDVQVGCSVGISLFPEDGSTPDELLQHASSALNRAKESGRGGYCFYTRALTRRAADRLDLEAGMRRALEREEFILHFQPLVRMADGQAEGVEALVRWADPALGLIGPGRFIPLAEETGLIEPLGAWVLREACRSMQRWRQAGVPLATMAVNLSPRQFRQKHLVRDVDQVLRESGLPASCLELEITESAVMDQGGSADAQMAALDELGVRLAIDDFGTGYSSLAILRRFPFSKLKIDQGFVRDIDRDHTAFEISATVIAMARALKLSVLAEGVEREDQRRILLAQGCDTCQGYLFSRPIPEPDLLAWLAAR